MRYFLINVVVRIIVKILKVSCILKEIIAFPFGRSCFNIWTFFDHGNSHPSNFLMFIYEHNKPNQFRSQFRVNHISEIYQQFKMKIKQTKRLFTL